MPRSKLARQKRQKAAKLFDSFPMELLVNIIKSLPMKDLLNVRLSNKRCLNVVNYFMNLKSNLLNLLTLKW